MRPSRLRDTFATTRLAVSLVPPLAWLWMGLVAFAASILIVAASCSGDEKVDAASARAAQAASDGVIDPVEKRDLQRLAIEALNGLYSNSDLTDEQREQAKLALQSLLGEVSREPEQTSSAAELGLATAINAAMLALSNWRRNKTRANELEDVRDQLRSLATKVLS